jgi:hypothetical protein
MTHLPGGDQLGHCPDGVLDRDGRIALVKVVEVDDVRTEPPQARITGPNHIAGIPPQREKARPEVEGPMDHGDRVVTAGRRRVPSRMNPNPCAGVVRPRCCLDHRKCACPGVRIVLVVRVEV